MSGRERRRSRSPRRPRSPRNIQRRRSRSCERRHRDNSPPRGRRGSPVYDRYTDHQASKRKPAWVEEDISEDDIRQEAGADPAEFRRLKRLKLNNKDVRSYWKNSPTPSPERKPKNAAKPAPEGLDGHQPACSLEAEMLAKEVAADAGAVSGLQEEIHRLGPEVAQLHMGQGAMFKEWLAEEKAIAAEIEKRRKQQEADDVMVGPQMEAAERQEAADYGTHMRPGEGTAMAAYVQSGKRIPRRGEVGMSADQIVNYEDLGYVMSGSRHNRMNAIRIRKENQVYTAEEKAALAMFNMEESKRKEEKILADMQRLVQRTIGEVEGGDGDEDEGDAGGT